MACCDYDCERASDRAAAVRSTNKRSPPGSDPKVRRGGIVARGAEAAGQPRAAHRRKYRPATAPHLRKLHDCCWFPAIAPDSQERLCGENPGDLPVQFPVKFEMVVNRNAATALGLAIPPSILLRATEVVE
jgi:hypothetical protein